MIAKYCPAVLKMVLSTFSFTDKEYYEALQITAKAGDSAAFDLFVGKIDVAKQTLGEKMAILKAAIEGCSEKIFERAFVPI